MAEVLRALRDLLHRLVYHRLDRPGWRWLVAMVATLHLSLRQRRWCLVWRDPAGWVHRYGATAVVRPAPGEPPPDTLREETLQEYCYAYVPRTGETVVDVGAGYGRETLTFSSQVGPGGRVIAVEAHPRAFEGLARMVDLNRLGNVTLVRVAIASGDGTASITDASDDLTNTLVSTVGQASIVVSTTSLDRLTREQGLDTIDFLKMNIEGGEALAIAGMRESLRRTRHVAIACHDFLAEVCGNERLRTFDRVRAFLEEMDFDVTTREGHPQPWTSCTLYGSNRRMATAGRA